MSKKGKKYRKVYEGLEKREYSLEEAVGFLKENSFAKFDESVDIAIRLGVNPK